ncbi:unnamed protein product [Malus baccata var. baccata]
MSNGEDYDSDTPEELTAEQGVQQDQELSKLQKEHSSRVVREAKERRRQWAQKKTPKKTQKPFAEVQSVQDTSEPKANQESLGNGGMLPSNIVELLASREKQKFLSDSEDEKTDSKSTKKKKKLKCSGVDAILLKETPAPQCLQNSLAFLEKRRMQVPRSSAVLTNSDQTLRLLSSSGLTASHLRGGERVLLVQPCFIMDVRSRSHRASSWFWRAAASHESLKSTFDLAQVLMVANASENNISVQGSCSGGLLPQWWKDIEPLHEDVSSKPINE